MMGASPEDLAKFAADKSGRTAQPAPGTEDMPEKARVWSSMHAVMHKYLSQTHQTNILAANYQRFFGERLEERFPRLGEWREARVVKDLMQDDMGTAAVTSLMGRRIFEVAPDIMDLFWEADEVLVTVLYGPPKWAFPSVYAKMNRFLGAAGRFYQDAWATFDWDGPDVDADWEPVFGSRYFRELSKWMKFADFSERTCAGITGCNAIVG